MVNDLDRLAGALMLAFFSRPVEDQIINVLVADQHDLIKAVLEEMEKDDKRCSAASELAKDIAAERERLAGRITHSVWRLMDRAIALLNEPQAQPQCSADSGALERTVRRYIESAVLWIPSEGVRGPNGLDATDTIDLLCKRMVAALTDNGPQASSKTADDAIKALTGLFSILRGRSYARDHYQLEISHGLYNELRDVRDRLVAERGHSSQVTRPK